MELPSVSGSEAVSHLVGGDRWPRSVTIESLLESGCGLHHKFAQGGCNGTCVKLETSNPPEVYVW